MLAAVRYRRAQALVLSVLSTLVITCLTLAPLYTRALEQASVRTLLAGASAEQTGLRLASASASQPKLALIPDRLLELVPARTRASFGQPVRQTVVEVRRMPLLGQPGGRLLAREQACDHVRFVAGSCPTAAGEIAVSTDQAATFQMVVGSSLEVGEWDGAVSSVEVSPRATLRVVGVYSVVPDGYWAGDRLTGDAATGLGFDAMLTSPETLTESVRTPSGGSTPWFGPQHAVDLALRTEAVGIDEIGPLGSDLQRLATSPMTGELASSPAAQTITVRTGIPAIADEVRLGASQAGTTVPLLMAQLGLLLGCVLWLVLVAAADQRRGEVAVARLRGRGARGARRLLLRETLPPVLVGVPLGVLAAVGLTDVARHTVLSGEGATTPPLDVPPVVLGVAAVGLALLAGLAVLSVRRVCREPVAALVRTIPARAGGARLGMLEAMLVAVAAVALGGVLLGSAGEGIGQVAPTLLALAVGVLAARALPVLLAWRGRRLLSRGRATAAVALLAASRRGTTRWVVPVVAVTLCLVVVTADVLAVATRNREGRAAAEVGAPTVLALDSTDLVAVATALRGLDPRGETVTPVAFVAAPGADGATTVGVMPDAFRRIALWPGVDAGSASWQRLTAPTVAPLVITGTRVSYRVHAPAWQVESPAIRPTPTDVVLALRTVRADGSVGTVPLGTIPAGGLDTEQAVAVDCVGGCRVTGVGLLAPPSSAAITGSARLSGLAIDGRALDLGTATDWRDTREDVEVTGSVAGTSVEIRYRTNGFDKIFLTHQSVPGVVPALTTPQASPAASTATIGGRYADGSQLLVRSEGRLTYVPGAPPRASLVHLDNLLAQGWRGRGAVRVAAYLPVRDQATLDRVSTALADKGIHVTSTTHPEDVAAAYGRSAASWSLQLAAAVGVLAVLVAAVALLVLTSTSWRARSRDYAALRLAGRTPRGLSRVALLETVPAVVVAALLGLAVGLWTAPVAVGLMPLFTRPPQTFPVDLGTAWAPALGAAAAATVALVGVAAAASVWVARRSTLDRLREAG